MAPSSSTHDPENGGAWPKELPDGTENELSIRFGRETAKQLIAVYRSYQSLSEYYDGTSLSPAGQRAADRRVLKAGEAFLVAIMRFESEIQADSLRRPRHPRFWADLVSPDAPPDDRRKALAHLAVVNKEIRLTMLLEDVRGLLQEVMQPLRPSQVPRRGPEENRLRNNFARHVGRVLRDGGRKVTTAKYGTRGGDLDCALRALLPGGKDAEDLGHLLVRVVSELNAESAIAGSPP